MRYASQLAEDYERLICRSIHGCSEWLLKALKTKSRFEEPQITDDGKSVKLLTVHASKGLEFPFVIIFGSERLSKSRKSNKSLIASKHLGLFASKHELFKMFHYALEEQAEAEEYQRLLYVAATRAKDSILFCGITDEKAEAESGSWLQYLIDWDRELFGLLRRECAPDEEPKRSTRLIDEETQFVPHRLSAGFRRLPAYRKDEEAGLLRRVELDLPDHEASLTRISATSYALFEWCPFLWRRKYRQGMNIDFENYSGTDKDSMSGKDIGSISHWILSKWDFSIEGLTRYFPDEKLIENVVRLLPPSLRASYRIKSNREKIRQWLLEFANSEIGEQFRILYTEKKLEREVPFKISVKNGIKLVGAFDVFWEDESGVHLRDWKTNPNDKVLELYSNQLIFYSYALHRIKGKLSTVGIISVKDCKFLDMSYNECFDGIEEKIIKTVNMATIGQWEQKVENCPMCSWKDCV
jgi:ATP-dependent exoDNAse (exonuclease V) beta subunit